MVTFIPNREQPGRTDQPFGEKAIEGVFVGYYLKAGCRWTGEYEVVPFADFADTPMIHGQMPRPSKAKPQRTSRVFVSDGNWKFPLRERYLRENGTLGGGRCSGQGDDEEHWGGVL